MRLLEHEAKRQFERVGIPIPSSYHVSSCATARDAAVSLGYPVMVKAQIPTGGRMKAGGITRATTQSELTSIVDQMLDSTIKGYRVNSVLIESIVDVASELYLSITIDRTKGQPVAIFSVEGGIDVEAADSDKIHQQLVDPAYGLQAHQIRQMAYQADVDREIVPALVDIFQKVYKLWDESDGTEIEINPLVITPSTDFRAVDAVFELDPDAMFRQSSFTPAAYDIQQQDTVERKADEYNFDYVRLDGNIGIIGNGAGLVMTTQDLIAEEGGSPANFLDIGGGADAQRMANALDITFSDPNVSVLLINIFGGITQCDVIAEGINNAIKKHAPPPVPVVVRLAGTNATAGRQQLDTQHLTVADSLDQAITKAVTAASSEEVKP